MNGPFDGERRPDGLRTPEQRVAIEATQPVVFVSAGAGTGKTSVLVDRYLRAVLEEGRPTREVPTVTFTRKAAGEMRQRIRGELAGRGRDDLAWELEGAPIGTIHSLCGRLLRAHALQTGIDPGFTVVDEDRAAILLEEATVVVWNRRLESAADSEIAVLSRHEKALRRAIPELYQGLRQLGASEPRFLPGEPSSPAPELRALVDAVHEVLEAASGFEPGCTADRNAARLRERQDWLRSLSPHASWGELEGVAYLRPHLGVGRHKPLFEKLAEAVEDSVRALGRGYLARLASIVDGMLMDFGALYTARKAELSALDFVDLELQTLQLLRSGVRPYGPGSLLLVDEFQDTNGLQCALLDMLGAESKFTVGDRQQSIYGFRGADVAVFEERQTQATEMSDGDAVMVPLTTNFRSSGPLLAAINRLFGSVGLFGDRYQPLHPPAAAELEATVAAPTPLELVVVDREGSAGEILPWAEAEARVIAARVRELVDLGRSPRDVVVLLRALTYVNDYEAAFRREGLPCYVVQGRGFYLRQELSDLLALLRVLIDPHDDLALATVLRSPIGRFSDDVLFLAREQARDEDRRFLWEALAAGPVQGVTDAEADRLLEFTGRLQALRRRVGSPGMATLLEEAVNRFDYDLALLSDPEGYRRYANVRKLTRLADEFEALGGPDLAAFLAHLEASKDLDSSREGSAAVLAEEDDVVRIMTVHQAKGLEFPVVIAAGLAGLGREASPPFMFDRSSLAAARNGGQIPQALRLRGSASVKGVELTLGPVTPIADELGERERQETIRLVYVAATRAQDRLLLVGTPLGRSGDSFERSPLASVLAAVGETRESVLQRSPGESWVPDDGAGISVTLAGAVGPPDAVCAPADSSVEAVGGQQPVPPPSPIPPAGRTPRAGHVSFSSLAHYGRCPRGYYLERVLGLRPARFEGLELGASESVDEVLEGSEPGGWRLGVAVHAVLECLDLSQEPSEGSLAEVVRQQLVAGQLSGVHQESVMRLARALWRSPLAALPGLGTASKEQSFVFLHRGTAVTGVMDVVGGLGDDRWVIDYKTNRLDGRTPAEAAEPYILQGQIYALALLLAGASSVAVHFLFLEQPQYPVQEVYGRRSVPALEGALDDAMAGLLEGRYAPEVGCEPCDLEGVCAALLPPRGTSQVGGSWV